MQAYGNSLMPLHEGNDGLRTKHDQMGAIGDMKRHKKKTSEASEGDMENPATTNKVNIAIAIATIAVAIVIGYVAWQVSISIDSNKNTANAAAATAVVTPELQRQITEVRTSIGKISNIENTMATKSDIAQLIEKLDASQTKTDVKFEAMTKLILDMKSDIGRLQGRQEEYFSRKK